MLVSGFIFISSIQLPLPGTLSTHSQVIRQYFTPENQSLIRIFGGFSGLSLSFIPFIIPSFAPVLPQLVSSYARNFGVKNERLDDI